MKINSINSFSVKPSTFNFKRTAVPYPEYEKAYHHNNASFSKDVTNVIDKISTLFSPKVTEDANKIKSSINKIYADDSLVNKTPKAQLMSVLA